MNQEALQQVIAFYKNNYAMIEKHELYKWKRTLFQLKLKEIP